MTDESGRIMKEAAVARLNVLSRHLPGGNEENNKSTDRVAVFQTRFEQDTRQMQAKLVTGVPARLVS
jgi:hypothetical protein